MAIKKECKEEKKVLVVKNNIKDTLKDIVAVVNEIQEKI